MPRFFACTGDNPVAKAPELFRSTGKQTVIYITVCPSVRGNNLLHIGCSLKLRTQSNTKIDISVKSTGLFVISEAGHTLPSADLKIFHLYYTENTLCYLLFNGFMSLPM